MSNSLVAVKENSHVLFYGRVCAAASANYLINPSLKKVRIWELYNSKIIVLNQKQHAHEHHMLEFFPFNFYLKRAFD